MRAQRVALVALVIVNLGYFAWTHGQLAMIGMLPASFAEHEPQRMTQQVRPGALQILKEPRAAAAPRPVEPPAGTPAGASAATVPMPDPESR
ncbi:MAG: hypothetical protein ABWZ88_14810 [Variovorax sp.]